MTAVQYGSWRMVPFFSTLTALRLWPTYLVFLAPTLPRSPNWDDLEFVEPVLRAKKGS